MALGITFGEYQVKTGTTAIYPGSRGIVGLLYVGLGACGEVGEMGNKVKKIVRDHDGIATAEAKAAIRKEIGGALWYLAQLCNELDISLGEAAAENIAVLASRKERGVLHGSGDDR